jgi:hypothetical protein
MRFKCRQQTTIHKESFRQWQSGLKYSTFSQRASDSILDSLLANNPLHRASNKTCQSLPLPGPSGGAPASSGAMGDDVLLRCASFEDKELSNRQDESRAKHD